MARWATTAPDTDEIVNLVVGLFAPLTVADDRSISAQRAPAGQQVQWKRRHPGSTLFSASGNAIKRINGWREGLSLTVAAKFRSEGWPSPSGKVSLERKKNTALICWKLSRVPHFGRYKSVIRSNFLEPDRITP